MGVSDDDGNATPSEEIGQHQISSGMKRTGYCGRAMRKIMWMNKNAFYGDEPEFIVGKGWAIH